MLVPEFVKALKSPEDRLAWLVAIAADTIQIALFPLFVAGGFSPADTVLDVIVGIVAWMALGVLARRRGRTHAGS